MSLQGRPAAATQGTTSAPQPSGPHQSVGAPQRITKWMCATYNFCGEHGARRVLHKVNLSLQRGSVVVRGSVMNLELQRDELSRPKKRCDRTDVPFRVFGPGSGSYGVGKSSCGGLGNLRGAEEGSGQLTRSGWTMRKAPGSEKRPDAPTFDRGASESCSRSESPSS